MLILATVGVKIDKNHHKSIQKCWSALRAASSVVAPTLTPHKKILAKPLSVFLHLTVIQQFQAYFQDEPYIFLSDLTCRLPLSALGIESLL